MNEQLIVKNFGPIKDATVDFKRVTVFIGPTGGGKSTLAKLEAICKDRKFTTNDLVIRKNLLKNYSIENYTHKTTSLSWENENGKTKIDENFNLINNPKRSKSIERFLNEAKNHAPTAKEFSEKISAYAKAVENNKMYMEDEEIQALAMSLIDILVAKISPSTPQYIPSDRGFVTSIASSFAGLMRDDIGIAKPLLNFANSYFQARDDIYSLEISFLGIEFFRHDSKDYISFEGSGSQTSLPLNETASGIQSVTPLLVLLEYLSRNTEQAQSFIIEEPELNLYPTAQQGLLNWLVEKCTKDENDLTITTHSPYLLAHFNTLLFAYQVAQNRPERANEIAKVVPRESWINPAEFAAYHVEGQQENGVRSIVNPETGLISYNGLDAIASAEASEFEKLLDINAGLSVEW